MSLCTLVDVFVCFQNNWNYVIDRVYIKYHTMPRHTFLQAKEIPKRPNAIKCSSVLGDAPSPPNPPQAASAPEHQLSSPTLEQPRANTGPHEQRGQSRGGGFEEGLHAGAWQKRYT